MSKAHYNVEEDKLPAFNIHPGEDLQDELKARNMTQKQFAELIGLQANMLNEVIQGKRRITPQIALRLEAGLQISADFWLKGQQMYDLYEARKNNQETLATIREKREQYFRERGQEN